MPGIFRFLTGRKRREQRNSHRRQPAGSWDRIEDQWPSPGGWASDQARAADAAQALDDELDWRARTGLLPRNELTGLPTGWAYWPLQQPAGLIEEEPPAPELLDDLPDVPHPHPSCCGRPQELDCAWLGERGYLCFTHDWRWHEAEERLAETGDWPAFAADLERQAAELDEDLGEPRRCVECGITTNGQCVYCAATVCSPCAATGHDCPGLDGSIDGPEPVAAAIVEALDQLDEEQLAELLGPDPGDKPSDPAADVDVTAETRAYVDDLEVLTRYRIPAGAE